MTKFNQGEPSSYPGRVSEQVELFGFFARMLDLKM
jgi:hypothetical protein